MEDTKINVNKKLSDETEYQEELNELGRLNLNLRSMLLSLYLSLTKDGLSKDECLKICLDKVSELPVDGAGIPEVSQIQIHWKSQLFDYVYDIHEGKLQ